MTWSTNPNAADSNTVVFTSNAEGPEVLACDLWCVLYQMLQRKAADGASSGHGIHIFTNVPNRSMELRWVDEKTQGVGNWTYTLKIGALFRAGLNTDDAADAFEDTVGVAVSWFVEDQDDLVTEEPVKEGWRPGLRPISWGKEGINYDHPAYELPMSKTSPVDIYWSSQDSPEIELFEV
ncbi:MAG: hypothetical protein ACI9VR_004164 [Cognaticolwellia sp.]|jgi:hypothetical protein